MKQYLVEDVKEVLLNLETSLASLDTELQRVTHDMGISRRELEQIERQLTYLDSQAKTVGDKVRLHFRKKSELEVQREECISVGQIDTSGYEREAEEVSEAITTMSGDINRLASDVDISRDELKAASIEKEKVDKKKAHLTFELREVEESINSALTRKDDAHKTCVAIQQQFDRKMKQCEEIRTSMQKTLDAVSEKTAIAAAETEKLVIGWDGEPLHVKEKETTDYLLKSIASKRALYEKGRALAGLEGKSKASLTEKIDKDSKAYNDELSKYHGLRKLIETLEEDYTSRLRKWHMIRDESAKQVKHMFDRYMQKKGFAGNIKFDNENMTLHITCQTDNGDEKTKCSDVRQLSGGERSYTTLSLLMALGHVVCTAHLL